MPRVRVMIDLPYLLVLPSGDYPTPLEGGLIVLAEALLMPQYGQFKRQTRASLRFEVRGDEDAYEQNRQRIIEADRLLRRVNHLLRWYRVTTGEASIIELTRAQASPFQFFLESTNTSWGGESPLEFEPVLPAMFSARDAPTIGEMLRQGMNRKTDPDVSDLNLLDAEYALSVGRFREAVLLCWGAIDSTFVRKFEALVDSRLTDEWPEGREFLKGLDFGLRHKMSTGLRLLIGRSLYGEPDRFWKELSESYKLRNKIIHEGQIAQEDDAKLAIRVTRRIVQIVAQLV
jgi:hypothetical protein